MTKAKLEHAHECRTCGHAVRIDDIDLNVIAIGVITCPKCETSGPINVKIIEKSLVADLRRGLSGKRQ